MDKVDHGKGNRNHRNNKQAHTTVPEKVHAIHNNLTIYHSSFAVCQGACHLALVGLEDRPPVEGRLREVPDYQLVEVGPQDEGEVGHQAHRSWAEGREDHQARHH
jgi:hypothetical protein